MPRRVQLQRTAGWRKPAGVVVVARPTKWGNPYQVHKFDQACMDPDGDHWCAPTTEEAVTQYRLAILMPVSSQPDVPTPDDIRLELAGKDLACWCPLDRPCHADVLLAVANEERS